MLIIVADLLWPLTQLCSFLFSQSNEVGGSYYMEREGLHRSIQYLKERDLGVKVIVTDRHTHINKWLRETHPEI